MVDSQVTTEVGVSVILIHGMGGIGKTTLAKLIYNQFSTKYHHRSFLSNVRERSLNDGGMVELKKQLISDILEETWAEDSTTDGGSGIIKDRLRNKEVLIVLDDVNHTNQLDALAKESGWFGPGSLLIITSRNKDILKKWDEKLTYGLEQLDLEQSFQLFCFHAFGREGARQSELEHIARKIVKRTGGLPLAIKVVGSQLFAQDEEYWQDTLQRLKETPDDDVMKILKISYDSLNREEKQIFLDIACFRFQIEKEDAYYTWDGCKFYPRRHVKNLISLSLVEIGDEDELTMHDQLSDLGKVIVREESSNDLKKHSRLWNQQDVWEVLNEIQGPKEVEALSIRPDEKSKNDCLTSKHFKDLTKLRLLFLDDVSLNGDFDNLLPNLKWLRWKGLSSMGMEAMPNHFHPKKLVVLDLYRIPVTEHWGGWSQPEVVQKLKVVRLEHCDALKSTPDFSAFKELEILTLIECSNLERIHPSIGSVRKTLKTLFISNCSNLEELPKQVGEMERLKELIVELRVRERPVSGGYISGINYIAFQMREQHMKLPDSIGNLGALSKLVLSNLSIKEVPESIGNLHNLEELGIGFCPSLKTIDDLHHLKKLTMLSLTACRKLRSAKGIGQLTSLEVLNIDDCALERIDDLSQLKKLRWLQLKCNRKLIVVEGIGELTSLEALIIDCCPFERIDDLSQLKKMEFLMLRVCERLSGVEGIGQLTSLKILIIRECKSFERIDDLSQLKKLERLHLEACKMLGGVDGIGQLTFLKLLIIKKCPSFERIDDLSQLQKLELLQLEECKMLSGVEGVGKLTSLKKLTLYRLPCIKMIDNLSQLTKLRWLHLYGCEMLSSIEGISQLTSLEVYKQDYLFRGSIDDNSSDDMEIIDDNSSDDTEAIDDNSSDDTEAIDDNSIDHMEPI